MHYPETLEDFQLEIRKVRLAMRDNARGCGLSPLAESHLELALASLDAAQTQLDIANIYQAQALAGAR